LLQVTKFRRTSPAKSSLALYNHTNHEIDA
jgi:hypothetical protein